MILLTVGSQLPFDRLVRALDAIAPELERDIFAQIGNSGYTPQNMRYEKFVDSGRMTQLVAEASVIVCHAGIGSIISAQKNLKPAIIFPRLAKFGEHRNDHQLATARHLGVLPGIYFASTGAELKDFLLMKAYDQPDMASIKQKQDAFAHRLGDRLAGIGRPSGRT